MKKRFASLSGLRKDLRGYYPLGVERPDLDWEHIARGQNIDCWLILDSPLLMLPYGFSEPKSIPRFAKITMFAVAKVLQSHLNSLFYAVMM